MPRKSAQRSRPGSIREQMEFFPIWPQRTSSLAESGPCKHRRDYLFPSFHRLDDETVPGSHPQPHRASLHSTRPPKSETAARVQTRPISSDLSLCAVPMPYQPPSKASTRQTRQSCAWRNSAFKHGTSLRLLAMFCFAHSVSRRKPGRLEHVARAYLALRSNGATSGRNCGSFPLMILIPPLYAHSLQRASQGETAETMPTIGDRVAARYT
ncbi:hypothetical protein C8R43DRAFT_1042578 [Mycena crocata]|nr:hypothetical protein C8R43DRAFT_1042578 [Mycena crocata]